jgi:basic membrane protein A
LQALESISLPLGGLGDKSFNDGCHKGALDAAAALDIEFTYVQPTAVAEFEGFLRTYAAHAAYDDPYDIIIGIGFEISFALMDVAADYPDQKFAIVDMWINSTTYPNVASLLFQEEQGSALVGAMAGLMTTQDKLGFVGGFDDPLLHKFLAGYVYGANITNPGIAYTFDWANTFTDPTTGYSLAEAQIAGGADVIYSAAGRTGLGCLDAARFNNASYAYPVWAIGVDSPQMYLGCDDPNSPAAPTVVMTSMLKRVDTAIHSIIEAIVDDTFAGGVHIFNLANGGIGYEPPTGLLPDIETPYSPGLGNIPTAVIDVVEDIKAGILNGSIVVPAVWPYI